MEHTITQPEMIHETSTNPYSNEMPTTGIHPFVCEETADIHYIDVYSGETLYIQINK